MANTTGKLRKTISLCSESNDGTIGLDEFSLILRKLSLDVPENEISELFGQISDTGSRISLESLTNWYITCEERMLKDLKDLFSAVDVNSSGTLSVGEIAK